MLVYKFINIRYSLFKVILVQKYFRKSENMHHVFKHSFCCIPRGNLILKKLEG